MDQDLLVQLDQVNRDIAIHPENAVAHATKSFLKVLLQLITSKMHTCDQAPFETSQEDLNTLKAAIRSFTTITPHWFDTVCSNAAETEMWKNMNEIIKMIVDDRMLNHQNAGVRLNVIKCLQVLVFILSKKDMAVSNDKDDVSLDRAGDNHGLLDNVQDLEEEGLDILHKLFHQLFIENQPGSVMTAIIHSLIPLTAKRPQFRLPTADIFLAWYNEKHPHLSSVQTKSVQKAIRIALGSIIGATRDLNMLNGLKSIYKDIGGNLERLARQQEEERRESRRPKRPILKREAAEMTLPDKRVKRDNASPATPPQPVVPQLLEGFDVTKMPLPIVIDTVIELLQRLPELGTVKEPESVKEKKPHVPLASVQERANQSFKVRPYELPASKPLDQESHSTMLEMSIRRVLDAEQLLQPMETEASTEGIIKGPSWRHSGKTMWLLLVGKLLTRGIRLPIKEAGPKEDVDMDSKVSITTEETGEDPEKWKNILLEFISSQLSQRLDLALEWLYEEYLCDIENQRINSEYEPTCAKWLLKLLQKGLDTLEQKDKTLTKLLLDSPVLTSEIIDLVQKHMQENQERFVDCLAAFRKLASQRLPVREQCLTIMLDLCVEKDTKKRNAGIAAVKPFVPDHMSISPKVEQFAVEALKAILQEPPKKIKEDQEDTEMTDADGDSVSEWKEHISRHTDLFFGLFTVKHELLTELFPVYISASEQAQRLIRESITGHIKAIGMRSTKLIDSLHDFPPGGETLVIRILVILCGTVRPTPELVAVVKDIYERNPDCRFLIPVISGLSKEDIRSNLHKIVELLNNTEGQQRIVRHAFSRIVSSGEKVTAPMTPRDLLVALHEMEFDAPAPQSAEDRSVASRAQRWEAIRTCLDEMKEVFGPKDIASSLQYVVDQERIPIMLMVTMIHTVKIHAKLKNFIISLLRRLLQKKVWKNAGLWDGFVKCIEKTLPEAVDVVHSLPKMQLKEVLEKTPSAHEPLRKYAEENRLTRVLVIMKEMGLIEEE